MLLDLSAETGLARRQAAGEANRFEQKVTDFHQAVRAGFLDLARGEPKRFSIIDAALSEDEVAAAIEGIVAQRFADRLKGKGRMT